MTTDTTETYYADDDLRLGRLFSVYQRYPYDAAELVLDQAPAGDGTYSSWAVRVLAVEAMPAGAQQHCWVVDYGGRVTRISTRALLTYHPEVDPPRGGRQDHVSRHALERLGTRITVYRNAPFWETETWLTSKRAYVRVEGGRSRARDLFREVPLAWAVDEIVRANMHDMEITPAYARHPRVHAALVEAARRAAPQGAPPAPPRSSTLPVGARALVDGRDEVVIRQVFPEGSSSFMFPHYKVDFVDGDRNVAIAIKRVGVERESRCGWDCSCCEFSDGTAPADHARDCDLIALRDIDPACTCEGANKRAEYRKRDFAASHDTCSPQKVVCS